MPRWMQRPLTAVHFFAMVYAQFERDRCYQMASALTFSALLAVVPVTAVTFAIFNAFGTFSSIRATVQEFLLKQLIPTSDLGQNLNHYLTQFTANTYQVTFLSVISLFVTAVTLFLTVEYSLGHIWVERKRRSFVRNVTIFTSILVWGPLLLGFSTYLSISLTTNAHDYVDPIIGSRLWTYLFPYATSVLMFFLGFTILPAATVHVRAALLGASFAALAWELAKAAFAAYTSQAVFYSSVYGTLSTVPVFLLWVYTSWLIFLYGAEICHCFQYHKWLRLRGDDASASYATNLLVALASMLAIARRFDAGGEPPDTYSLSSALEIPEDVILRALHPLKQEGLLMQIRGDQEIYLPSRSTDRIKVLEVFRAIDPSGDVALLGEMRAPEFEGAGKALRLLQESQTKALADLTIADLAACK